jgi:hypothetical protein
MIQVMNDDESIARLKELEKESATIRQRLGLSPPNTVIFRASIDPIEDEDLMIEADGFGGATLSIVEGNYPIDFQCLRETRFPTERAAIEAAEHLINRTA